MNIIKKTITGLMLLFVLLPLAAQEKPDTVYTFRFVTDKDMFYVPFSGNDKDLSRVDFEVDEAAGILRITPDYTIRRTNRRTNMVYPFYLHEGTDLVGVMG